MNSSAPKLETPRGRSSTEWAEARCYGLFTGSWSGGVKIVRLDGGAADPFPADSVEQLVIGPAMESHLEENPEISISDYINTIQDKVVGLVVRLSLGEWTREHDACSQSLREGIMVAVEGRMASYVESVEGVFQVEVSRVDKGHFGLGSDSFIELSMFSEFYKLASQLIGITDYVDLTQKSGHHGRVKNRSADRNPELKPQSDDGVDLERELLSQSPEVAQARLLRMAVALARKHPQLKKSLRSGIAEAIKGRSGGARTENEECREPEVAKVVKEVKTPPLTEHPLVKEFSSLWENRNQLTRIVFTRKFQKALNKAHDKVNLNSYIDNNCMCKWINFIAKKERIKLMLPMEGSTDLAVTMFCANQSQHGYFVPRTAEQNPVKVKGRSSPEFPRLIAFPL